MGFRPVFVFVALIALAAELVSDGPTHVVAQPKPVVKSDFTEQVVPFIAKYCAGCHNDKKKSAGLSLEKYKDEKLALKDRKVWQDVVDNIHSREMPPSDKPQPSPAEREKIEKVIVDQLTKVDCGLARDPGQPTLRRLNRAEYANTIRDLVGVSFNPADDFPSDDVGYGFDNIGDVLSMPPILLEKYLRAADRIMDEAIVVQAPAQPSKQSFSPQALQATLKNAKDPRMGPKRMHLYAAGEVFVNQEPSHEGEYVVRVDAFTENTTDKPTEMSFHLDGKPVKKVEVKATAMNKTERHEFRTKVSADKHKLSFVFANPLPEKANAADKRSLSITKVEVEGPFNAVPKPLPESQKRLIWIEPKNEADKEATARRLVAAFVNKAYRRPSLVDEIDRLMKLYRIAAQEKEPFEKCVAYAMKGALVSPNFLFRIEQDKEPLNPKAVHPVNEHELATRLSYFLWSTMPDDALRAIADKGELRKPGVLDAQIKRMLKDPKAKALTDNFAAQWLQLRMLDAHTPDRRTFPGADTAMKNLMIQETLSYFDYVMKEDRSVLEFLDSDYTFVNDRLARFYGMPAVQGSEFRKVTIDRNQGGLRGGILTNGSVLTLTSNATRTSPVKRGKWILETILGTPPPPPPPDAPPLKEDGVELTGSLRQRMEQHRTNPACASCHAKMDPLGFGMENFNAVGQWRAFDGKFKIDAGGTLPAGEKFDGPEELRKTLMGKADLFRRNLAEKMLTYAIGRGTEYYDKCALDDIVKDAKGGEDRFSALVGAVVKSDPFQKRRGRDD